MKKYISNSVKSFAAVVAICLATSFSAGAQSTGKASLEPEQAVSQLNYLGTVNSQPLFAVTFDNKDADKVYVTLKDEDGFVLYAQKFNGEKYYQKFLFDGTDATGDAVLTLTFSSKKGKSSQSFRITKNIRTIEDVVVNKVAMN